MSDKTTCSFNPWKCKLPANHTFSLFREHAGSTFIFTGNLKPNYTAGCAANIYQSEYSAKISDLASSYTRELNAIILGIKNVLYRHFGNNFTIFTDS